MNTDTILVINCGSSSLKFSLIQPSSGETLLNGLAECLSTEEACIKVSFQAEKTTSKLNAPFDHQVAINQLVENLKSFDLADNIVAIGHRVVHGGEKYSQPVIITQKVKDEIKELSKLAPLHNPAHLMGIDASEAAFSGLPQVAVFDTAFHQTMPEKAYIYAIPYELYQDHGIRRYGFHGTSHFYVAHQAAEIINKPINECNFISAHLGNGCSITAVKNGKSVDVSMGLTPLEGTMMGTRSGDLDPSIIFHLIDQLGYTSDEVNQILNKKSGLLGVSGISNDCREVSNAMLKDNNPRAKLAIEIFCYRIAKVIASFTASLSELDGIIFTGGIGENSVLVREKVIAQLKLIGLTIDKQLNAETMLGKSGVITTPDSVKAIVVTTDEEWVIADQTQKIISGDA